MRVLLDTNVVSELRTESPNAGLLEFLAESSAGESFLSVITIGEIVFGIERLPIGRRREDLDNWLSELVGTFTTRILDVDLSVAQRWGLLAATIRSSGYQIDAADGLIAATALVHDLVLVTRNVRDFEHTGVRVLNPWTC